MRVRSFGPQLGSPARTAWISSSPLLGSGLSFSTARTSESLQGFKEVSEFDRLHDVCIGPSRNMWLRRPSRDEVSMTTGRFLRRGSAFMLRSTSMPLTFGI